MRYNLKVIYIRSYAVIMFWYQLAKMRHLQHLCAYNTL